MEIIKTTVLPEGCVLCEHIHRLYRLKPRKKNRTKENIEKDIGKEYYIYSEFNEVYYKRILNEETSDDELMKYINRKILFV